MVFLAVLSCLTLPLHAQTWRADPGSAIWSDAANWDPATVPNGSVTASFQTSTTTTVTVDGAFAIDAAGFSGDDFTFEIGAGHFLMFTGDGVVTTAAQGPHFQITQGGLFFENSATAATSTIDVDNGSVFFEGSSGADEAVITTSNAGTVSFADNSAADDAVITNETGGVTSFMGSSSACCAYIFNQVDSQTTFNNSSTADGAAIWNDQGVTVFTDTSTAYQALIVNSDGGNTLFLGSSAAGEAAISNHTGGYTGFTDNATAGTATISNTDAATTFSGDATAANATIESTDDSYVEFSGNSTAGAAIITTDETSRLYFVENSTAGTAQITAAGDVFFTDTASAPNATIEANGLLDITGNTSGSVEIASLSGSTRVVLGGNDLLLGTMKWDGGGAMRFDLGLDPGLIDITGAFERGDDGTFEFVFTLEDGAAPGLYTLIKFGSTTFSEDDFTFNGPSKLAGYFVMNGSSLGFQVTAVPEPEVVSAAFVALAVATILVRRRSARTFR